MLRWIQSWLRPLPHRSAESLSVDADGQPILDSRFEWLVEINGQPVASLSDPKYADMFWVSYQMTPLTEEPQTLADLHDLQFWLHYKARGATLRNRATSAVASRAYAGETSLLEQGRIVMRALY